MAQNRILENSSICMLQKKCGSTEMKQVGGDYVLATGLYVFPPKNGIFKSF